MEDLLYNSFMGNSVGNYLLCFGILLLGFFIRNLISKGFSRLLFKVFRKFSNRKFSEEFVGLLKSPFKLLFELIFLYIAFYPLVLPQSWNIIIYKGKTFLFVLSALYELALIVSITWILLRLVDFISLVLMSRALLTEDKSDDQLVGFFKELIKFILAVFALFFVLGAVFNLNITALVTGLGLGGLAIALAAQETLGNLLASFIIFLDKPFKAGDLVNVSDITGTVEKVGFRSTRIRTLDKSLLTVPNKKMIDAPLNNITLSSFRRVRFSLKLLYSTGAVQLKKICDEIKTELQNHELVDEDITVRFTDYGESSLDILVVFFVKTNEWDVMMDVRERLNYKVMEIVENNGTGFAYPTRTLYLDKNFPGT